MRRINFTKKVKKPFSLVDALNTKKYVKSCYHNFFIKKWVQKSDTFLFPYFRELETKSIGKICQKNTPNIIMIL
jgi:hypothetical protein